LSDISELEIDALAKIAEELSYYQLLQVEPGTTGGELKKAYYALSRSYHPDANRNRPEAVQQSCHRISKVLTEAYCVLRDPRKRKAYDAQLEGGGALRIQLAEAAASHARSDSARRSGTTAQGKQFLMKAEEDVRNGQLASAIQNLQMALTFEPGNVGFKEMLEELRKQQQTAK